MEKSFEIKWLVVLVVGYYESVILVGTIIYVKPVNCGQSSLPKPKRNKIISVAQLKGQTMSNYSSTAGTNEWWPSYSLMLDSNLENGSNIYQNISNTSIKYVNGSESQLYCGEWEAAQHNLFQLSNLCFVSAFLAPRNYKPSVLLLRALLCLGFFISAAWAGVHVCLFDAFVWNMVLGFLNGVHTLLLICRFCPPALSLELTELYVRVFKPLKVSKKHFKELTREVSLHQLHEQEAYATEECTPADERLSILLKGRLKVTCGGTHLHFINCYQFIDSPEWEANNQTNAELFQVTIIAEEESSYLCWSRIKLDRVLRHRPQLRVVFSHIIGKDITQKLYCLNEQVGQRFANDAQSRAVKEDLWRSLNRSVSVDAVNTGTHGHVRSTAWNRAHQADQRKYSVFSDYTSVVTDSPDFGQRKCWIPVVASQFPATSPFAAFQQSGKFQEKEPILEDQDEVFSERQALISLPEVTLVTTTCTATVSTSIPTTVSIPIVPVTLIPVIVPVPVIAAAPISASPVFPSSNQHFETQTTTRSSLKKQREVTFDETKL